MTAQRPHRDCLEVAMSLLEVHLGARLAYSRELDDDRLDVYELPDTRDSLWLMASRDGIEERCRLARGSRWGVRGHRATLRRPRRLEGFRVPPTFVRPVDTPGSREPVADA